jgi:hypothetical protein
LFSEIFFYRCIDELFQSASIKTPGRVIGQALFSAIIMSSRLITRVTYLPTEILEDRERYNDAHPVNADIRHTLKSRTGIVQK